MSADFYQLHLFALGSPKENIRPHFILTETMSTYQMKIFFVYICDWESLPYTTDAYGLLFLLVLKSLQC